MTKIILITHPSCTPFAYTSITAAIADPDNPVSIKKRRWSQIVAESGYPFEHSGATVHLIYAKGAKDIETPNP